MGVIALSGFKLIHVVWLKGPLGMFVWRLRSLAEKLGTCCHFQKIYRRVMFLKCWSLKHQWLQRWYHDSSRFSMVESQHGRHCIFLNQLRPEQIGQCYLYQMTKTIVLPPCFMLFWYHYSDVIIKENIKAPRHWPLCGEFTGTGEFPAQRARYAENVSIWWRHHVVVISRFYFQLQCCKILFVNYCCAYIYIYVYIYTHTYIYIYI